MNPITDAQLIDFIYREAELIDRANAALSPYGEKAENLRELARFVIDRQS